ncbi:unnamed protein product [Caenorhabditis brenneri]
MDLPRLFDLSAEYVAKYIVQGYYETLPRELPKKESNLVFDLVNNQRHNLSEEERNRVDETLKNMNNTSIMNFNCFTVFESDIALIRNKNIEELGLRIIQKNKIHFVETVADPMQKTPVTDEAEKSFDIVALLENNLTLESKRKLTKLDLSSRSNMGVIFENGWVSSIAQLLPSLTSLKLAGQLIALDEFCAICTNFPHLVTLDIRETFFTSLEGISKLAHLNELTMGSTFLQNIDDIYNLSNLKYLYIRGMGRNDDLFDALKSFINSEKSLFALEEFDCSNNGITNEDLKSIERRHPKLNRIIVTGTQLNNYTPEKTSTKIITDDTIASCLEALSYYQEICDHNEIEKIIEKIHRKVETPVEELTKEVQQNLIRTFYQMIRKTEKVSKITIIIELCCRQFSSREQLQLLDNGHKRVLIECLLIIIELNQTSNPHHIVDFWMKINRILEETENPQTDKIVSMALRFFLLVLDSDIKFVCLGPVAFLLDNIDLESGYYGELDEARLIFELQSASSKYSMFRNFVGNLENFFATQRKQK